MRLLPLKTAEEMEAEYRRRLQSCTLRSSIVIAGLVVFAIYMALMFSAPYLPGYDGQDPYVGLCDGPYSY